MKRDKLQAARYAANRCFNRDKFESAIRIRAYWRHARWPRDHGVVAVKLWLNEEPEK